MSLLDLFYRAEGRSAAGLLEGLRREMPARLQARAERLAAHLDWCARHVPMYNGMLPAADPFARLAALPPYPKQRLDASSPAARELRLARSARRDHTSGTSGQTFHFLLGSGELALRRAYEQRANELLGFAPGARHLIVWGGHESQGWTTRLRNGVYGVLQHRELRVVPAAGAGDLAPLLPRLEAHRGGVLVTYPSILQGFCEAGALPLLREFSAILLTGEAVDFRHFEGSGLGNLRNRYGTREFGAVAMGFGQDLCYFADRFVLEADEELGLLVTDMAKRAMPMLRYPVGDFVEDFHPEAPADPRLGLPPLGRLQGRVMDRLRGRSGRRFVGTFWTLTMRRIGVEKFRIIELAPAELDVLFVAPFDETELLRRLSPFLAGEFRIQPRRRESIPELRNAKQKVVVARAD